ncbi:MAG TPA: hypothetical protein VGE91_00260 [Solirubrobacterales bacterium]|jgi:hypothetical protein
MERSAWTDERLDDRFDQIDRRFDQVDRRFDRLESEMREGFASIRAEMHDGFAGIRGELQGEVGGVRTELGELRAEFASFRNLMFRSYVALAIALIAAIVARGF